MFDANTILNMQIEGATSTQLVPVPIGEYTATVSKLEPRVVTRQDGSSTPIVRVVWMISDPGVQAVTGREQNYVQQDLWLDMLPSGALDMSPGANIALGRLREAVGQNNPGQPWAFTRLIGQTARILVDHRTDDAGNVYPQVRRVSALR